MISVSQFRNLEHLAQQKIKINSCAQPRHSGNSVHNHKEKSGNSDVKYFKNTIDEGPSDHLKDSFSYCSTESESLAKVRVEKVEPDLGGSGSVAMNGCVVTPTIADSDLLANGNLFCGESAMSYSAGGFVKIPRSLFTHPAWKTAKPKHRYIFLEFLFRATWAPTFFYWKGTRIDLAVGQLYFSRNGLAEELTAESQSDDKITEADIRGALRYFLKIKFIDTVVVSTLTSTLTNGPTIIRVLYKTFSDEDIFYTNQHTNQQPNQQLTSTSPIKEEDKEHKEKKYKVPPAPASAVASRLCSIFLADLKMRMPKAKIPQSLSAWDCEFDRMLNDDKFTEQEIESALGSLQGHFYAENVRSPAKFRKEFARFCKPVMPGAAVQKKAITLGELRTRVAKKNYTVDENYQHFVIQSLNGLVKIAKDDTDGINKWLNDRSL